MKAPADELGIKEYPLSSHDELDDIAPLFQGLNTTRSRLGGVPEDTRGFLSPRWSFMTAGHALAPRASMVRGQKEMLSTPDVCFTIRRFCARPGSKM